MGQGAEYLNRKQIEEVIPHKGSSVFIDEAAVIPGLSATATLAKIPALLGSGQQEIPQFVLTDGMAQTFILVKPPQVNRVGLLTGINRMTISRRPLVTEKVTFEATPTVQRGDIGKAHVITRVGDEVLIEADYSYAVVNIEILKSIQ